MTESEKYQRLADMSKMLEENGMTAKEVLQSFVDNYNKMLEFVKSVSESHFEPRTLNESYMQTNSIILASKLLLKEIGEL